METNRKILVAGGDKRQLYAAEKLAALLPWQVDTIGLSKSDVQSSVCSICEETFPHTVKYDALVLPVMPVGTPMEVPVSDGGEALSVQMLLQHAAPGAVLFCGRCSDTLQAACQSAGVEPVDYLEREEFCLGNAVPTAEGAIQIAMEQLPCTLYGANVLVTGGGRIGMALASRLTGLGAKVYVCARRCETRAFAAMLGYAAYPMEMLETLTPKMQVVMNTVPKMVINEAVLEHLPEDVLIIDLASKPGGVDFAAAKSRGISVVWALSLPPMVWCCHRKNNGKKGNITVNNGKTGHNCENATKMEKILS